MTRGKWCAERGSLIYIAFYVSPPYKKSFRGSEKKIIQKKIPWRRGVVAFCCIPTVLAVFEKRRRGESLVLASVRLAFSSFYAIWTYSATRPPFSNLICNIGVKILLM
jgi:hypothetical protein